MSVAVVLSAAAGAVAGTLWGVVGHVLETWRSGADLFAEDDR